MQTRLLRCWLDCFQWRNHVNVSVACWRTYHSKFPFQVKICKCLKFKTVNLHSVHPCSVILDVNLCFVLFSTSWDLRHFMANCPKRQSLLSFKIRMNQLKQLCSSLVLTVLVSPIIFFWSDSLLNIFFLDKMSTLLPVLSKDCYPNVPAADCEQALQWR